MDGGTVIVCCWQQGGGWSGGAVTSGRSEGGEVDRRWWQEGGGGLGRGGHLGAVVGEGHGCVAERAADLALGGGADHAAVAVLVVGGDGRELVAGELAAERVVRLGLFGGRAAVQRPELEQGLGGGGAVEVAVVAGRAVVGAVGAAVVGVQVRDQLGGGLGGGGGPASGGSGAWG